MAKSIKSCIFAALMLFGLASCNEKENTIQTTEAETEMSNDSATWKAIEPDQIRNTVGMLRDDWMALAVGKEGDMNAMTIGWGDLGVLWNKPIFTVYVSTDRYTHEFMQRNEYFTVTAFPEEMHDALVYIGSHSGREGDKLTPAGLHPTFTELGNPIFEEANLAIECKIIYAHQFELDQLCDDVKAFYGDRGMGIHYAYIGEIVNVWEKQ